ncbi:MAG: FAD-dependent oxidoreductase [Deltaproteobacteria bacterium]|nr:FAD-dependent oxidoreductase [Deltaproteobacteria bacterium]
MSYDLCVIGGGISGLGIAKEAQLRGLKTCLLEKSEIASSTSDNSLRIIHGGFRYLQSADILKVIESMKEQESLLKQFPDFIVPLPCLMPLNASGLKSKVPVSAALTFYDVLKFLFRAKLKRGKVLTKEQLPEISYFSQLKNSSFLQWYDALLLEPKNFSVFLAQKLSESGVDLFSKTACLGISRKSLGYEIACNGGVGDFLLSTKMVVNAAGAAITTIPLEGIKVERPQIKWLRAFNLVMKKQISSTYAIGIESSSGRLFFAVPRGAYTAIGTEYLPMTDNSPEVKSEEVEVFLDDFNSSLPGYDCSSSDIEKIEIGILPANSAGTLFSKKKLLVDGKYCEVVSTKYTTFQSQARSVLDTLLSK